jgi:hypothetical protein
MIGHQKLSIKNRNEMHKNCRSGYRDFLLVVAFGLLVCSGAQAQFNYTPNGDGTITLTGYTGGGGNVSIPHKIDGHKVSAIGTWAFDQNTSMKSLTLPNTVTSIGDLAFENCSSLDTIYFGTSLTSIASSFGGSAFTSVTIPRGVVSIQGSFWSCLNLTNVTIPASVSTIESDFYYCPSLQTITVDVRNRRYSTADGVLFNKAQTELILCPAGKSGTYTSPNTVTSIGEYAFAWCTDLSGVVLPEGLTSIGFASFSSCMGLSSITIPASVTSIDDWSFSQCYNLTAIYFQGNAPALGGFDVFFNDNVNSIVAYYLPGTTGWEQFTAITGVPAVPWLP